MKRIAMALVIGVVVAVLPRALFAQANVASVDIVPLVRSGILVDEEAGFGLGFTYERLMSDRFSLGAHLEFAAVDKQSYFGLDAHGRWYLSGGGLGDREPHGTERGKVRDSGHGRVFR
jgi:hypothetical protein